MTVSVLGVGCATLGAWWHGHPDASWRQAIDAAIAGGITLFDTADSYGMGRSERLLGQLLQRHDDVVLITKAGVIKTPASVLRILRDGASSERRADGWGASRATLTRDLARQRCVTPGYVLRSVDASRRKLRRPVLDVFLLHSPPPDGLEDKRLLQTLHRLRRSGKVRSWGVSAGTVADAEMALEMAGIDCLEIRMDVCDGRGIEPIVDSAADKGVAVIARQPFGSGVLAERAGDGSRPAHAPSPETILSACLRYPLSQRGVSAVVAGMGRPGHVQDNLRFIDAPPSADVEIEDVRRWLCGGPDAR
jgi:aryl-alcohol dehydrogenase-like predicted oxidoreductase